MTDIMQDFKNKRFSIAPSYLTDTEGHLVILIQIGFWAEHYEELQEWCEQHNSTPKGMTVEIPDEATLTLFLLRWS